MKERIPMNIISLFSGCCGLDLGFELDDLRKNVPGFVAPQMYIYIWMGQNCWSI